MLVFAIAMAAICAIAAPLSAGAALFGYADAFPCYVSSAAFAINGLTFFWHVSRLWGIS